MEEFLPVVKRAAGQIVSDRRIHLRQNHQNFLADPGPCHQIQMCAKRAALRAFIRSRYRSDEAKFHRPSFLYRRENVTQYHSLRPVIRLAHTLAMTSPQRNSRTGFRSKFINVPPIVHAFNSHPFAAKRGCCQQSCEPRLRRSGVVRRQP